MSIVPSTLEEWTLETILALLEAHAFEDARFDWKEDLQKAPPHRLAKTAAGMANGLGGFLVFGVADDRKRSPLDRIVGVDSRREFAQQVTDNLASADPPIRHRIRQPPIAIPNRPGAVVHVVEVLSGAGPHSVSGVFPRRTLSGSAPMSTQEVRELFMHSESVRSRLRLLLLELAMAREATLAFGVYRDSNLRVPLHPIETRLLGQLHADVRSSAAGAGA